MFTVIKFGFQGIVIFLPGALHLKDPATRVIDTMICMSIAVQDMEHMKPLINI